MSGWIGQSRSFERLPVSSYHENNLSQPYPGNPGLISEALTASRPVQYAQKYGKFPLLAPVYPGSFTFRERAAWGNLCTAEDLKEDAPGFDRPEGS
jgi:hypothetical protein